MRPDERINEVLKFLRLTPNRLAQEIGIKGGRPDRIYNVQNGTNGISMDLANLIAGKFPELNIDWLLTGEGEMLLSDKPKTNNVMNEDENELKHRIELLEKDLSKAEGTIIEKDQLIREKEQRIRDKDTIINILNSQLDQQSKKRDPRLEDGGRTVPARRH